MKISLQKAAKRRAKNRAADKSAADKSAADKSTADKSTADKSANKKRGKKRRDNHLSFRATDDEFDIVAERMARTGETQSDAVRAIIRESQDKTGNVHLAPKTPPEQFEKLLGELQKWRMAFSTARPRLNIATPAVDDERYAEVVAWRVEAARLLAEIPKLEALVNVALNVMTCLTTERVTILRACAEDLIKSQKGWREKNKHKIADNMQIIIDLLEDAGIKPEGQK